MRSICETLRNIGVLIHNNAFGRKRSDQIKDPKQLWKFSWEELKEPKIQTVDEMKEFMLGLATTKGVKVTTNKDKDGNG